MKNTSKYQQLHAVWDTHLRGYSQRPVDFDPAHVSQLMADIFCPGPSCFYILDFADRQFSYVSPSVKELLGVDSKGFTLNDLLALVHPNDVPHVGRCEKKILEFAFNKLQAHQMTKYKFVYQFRVQYSDGTYRQVLHQALALSLDGFGRISKVLDVHTDISHLSTGNNYRLSFIGLQGEPSYLGVDVANEKGDYLGKSQRPYTRRELEIIRLLADGQTAKQVAGLLGISAGTVRSHRKNVLIKSGCANMVAVVAKCVREGLV